MLEPFLMANTREIHTKPWQQGTKTKHRFEIY